MEILAKENEITSLDLLKEINLFREQEAINTGKIFKILRHDTLLSIIRNEFEEEISLQEILERDYTNERGRKYPMFILTLDQAKQVLMRERK